MKQFTIPTKEDDFQIQGYVWFLVLHIRQKYAFFPVKMTQLSSETPQR